MITFEQLEAEVRKLAKEKPDFIYWPNRSSKESCKYNANEQQPGCIFGQALSRLGVTIHPEDDKGTIPKVLALLGVEYTDEQRAWALRVQNRQDNMNTWAYAVSLADSDMYSRRTLSWWGGCTQVA